MADPEASLAAAHAAAGRADWEQVMLLLADLRPADADQRIAAALLGARAALQAGSPARALEALDGLPELDVDRDELTIATMLRGAAAAALGRVDEGIALLERAVADAVADRRFEARLELARAYWRADRLNDVAIQLDVILSADTASGVPGAIVARAFELYGWLELRHQRRPIAARHFRDALDALAGSTTGDGPLRAALLSALLATAIDTLDLRLLARIQAEIDAVDSEGLALRERVPAPRRALADLLVDELDRAWSIGFDLRADAAAGIQQVVADVTAAQIARAAGESWTPARLLKKAAAVARATSWEGADVASQSALLTVIAETAPADVETARALLATYELLPKRGVADRLDDYGDIAPLEHLARAAIAGATGDFRCQVRNVHRAITLCAQTGNDYGELQAVLVLADIERDAGALERADALTRLVPRSWLRRRYETLVRLANGARLLTPTERNVMLGIARGLSTRQLAEAFGRSTNTIRNQTRRVYTVMGVHSRSALVARCAHLGLLEDWEPYQRQRQRKAHDAAPVSSQQRSSKQ